MTVRRLKGAQLGPWCSYCTAAPFRATHRGLSYTKFACIEHLPMLQAADRKQAQQDSCETEGERQALGRFWA
jgi:hypothetical protein